MLPVEILPVQETIVLRARGSELLILPHHVKKLKGFTKPRDFSQYFTGEALVNRPARKLFEAWLRKDHTLWPRLYQTVHKEMDVDPNAADGDAEEPKATKAKAPAVSEPKPSAKKAKAEPKEAPVEKEAKPAKKEKAEKAEKPAAKDKPVKAEKKAKDVKKTAKPDKTAKPAAKAKPKAKAKPTAKKKG